MPDYEFDEEGKQIAENIVKREFKIWFDENFSLIDLEKVAFIKCYNQKTAQGIEPMNVHAQCKALDSLERLLSLYKYAIFIYPSFEFLPDIDKKKVIFHEILHIPRDFEKMSVLEHDIAEFREVIKRFGLSDTLE